MVSEPSVRKQAVVVAFNERIGNEIGLQHEIGLHRETQFCRIRNYRQIREHATHPI